jgi:hypothetical protein
MLMFLIINGAISIEMSPALNFTKQYTEELERIMWKHKERKTVQIGWRVLCI